MAPRLSARPLVPAPVPVLVLVLVLVRASAQDFDQLDYCSGTCPNFNRISQNPNYEERLYQESVWMCTSVESTSSTAVLTARNALKTFREQQSQALGSTIEENTWPGLISVKGRAEYEMCWLLPPGLTLTDSDLVRVKTFPQTSMFVRTFGGVPSIAGGEENVQTLRDALKEAGQRFDSDVYYGAGYDSYLSLTHHNEIWIPKTTE